MKFLNIVIVLLLLFPVGYGSVEILKDVCTGRVIGFDKEGNLYTPNNKHTIHKYSPSGKFLLEFGRPGRGPGDIQRLGAFAIHPVTQNIYVTEFFEGNRWISIFSPQGKFIDTWKLKLNYLEWRGLGNIGFDSDGNAYIAAFKMTSKPHRSFNVAYVHSHIFRVKPDGSIERTICRLVTANSVYFSGKGLLTIPYHNDMQFDIHDNLLAVTESHLNYIRLFSTDGKPVKKLELPYEMEKVQKKDLDDWEKGMIESRGKRQVRFDLKFWKKNMPLPEYKPVTFGVSFDKRGNILVLRITGTGMERKNMIWYKVNIDTGKATAHNFGKDIHLLAVDKDYFYLFRYDEDDNPITYRLSRKKINF